MIVSVHPAASAAIVASMVILWRPVPMSVAPPPAAASMGATTVLPAASTATVAVVGDEPPAAVEPTTDPATDPAAAKPARVYLVIDRRTDAKGYVEREDDEEIVIRWKDTLLTFPKSRLLRIDRLVDPTPGQIGTVLTREGQVRRGEVIEDGFDAVVMRIEGIRTTIPRAQVESLHLEATFDEQYRRFVAETKPNDYIRRVELARWLLEQQRYEMARDELEEIISVTDNPEAERLLKQVRAQLLLGGSRSSATEPADDAPGADEVDATTGAVKRATGPVAQRDLLPSKLLSKEDVNLIRVYELDMNDPPRLAVSPETIRAMIEQHASSNLIPANSQERTALFRLEPVQLVSLLFRLKARELYPQIEVLSEPAHLNVFRQRVHNTWLIETCATSRCHGGVDAGRFFLHNRNYKDDRVRYTNLMIMDQLRLEDRGGEMRLIDYDDPMMSLLVQYALPRTEARYPHPDVPGWRPVFGENNRRLLEDTLKWIRGMFRPRPKYPVDYEPPKLDARDGETREALPNDR